MRLIPVLLIVALVASTPLPHSLASSGSVAQSGLGVINGIVVDGTTGAAVPNATTNLAPFIPAGSMPAAQFLKMVRNGRADAEGRFSFAEVGPGDYDVSASADGYAPGGYGQTAADARRLPFSVTAGAKLPDVTIKIWKTSSIVGTVTTESGEAFPDARISLWQRRDGPPGGQVGFVRRVTNAKTDQSGRYELSRIAPGAYVVGVIFRQLGYSRSVQDAYHDAVTTRGPESIGLLNHFESTGLPTPSGRGIRVGEQFIEPPGSTNNGLPFPPPSSGAVMTYTSTFHASARRPEDASVITLGIGEAWENVNLRVPVERTFRVAGVARGPDGPAALVGLRLVLAASAIFLPETTMEVAATVTDANGAFTLVGVPAGRYVLAGIDFPPRSAAGVAGRGASAGTTPPPSRPTVLGRVDVTVATADLTGLTVTLDGIRRRP